MKKRNLKNLTLRKKSISNLFSKGGFNTGNPSGGSEHNPNSMDILKCSPASVIPNTDCGCA
ncbi:hypothetical protein [Kordia jejudonensis]|uniref:hypothetical protein n=1 Tax=Kordia jejudonensis TaxID=1348245 RepID=UPI00062906C0|nr:hypothetical protein [Kordia jejudonensis]